MIDILHNDGFPAPIIVFVNQKKTADMVCKDIQRAGVRVFNILFYVLFLICLLRYVLSIFSYALLHYTQVKIKSSVKPPCSPYGMVILKFLWLRILRVVVSMCRMSVWSSITKWPTQLKLMYIVSVR